MSDPKVSVCIDSFNYGRYLPEAIESVLAQDFADFEVVISDDCSTDDSFAITQRYAATDSRIRATRNPANLGMVKNRNACLALARGEYVKWLHADDFLCATGALRQMADALDRNRVVSLVASARRVVSEDSKPIDVWSSFERQRKPVAGTTVINRCLFEQRNLIGGPSAVMFRRSLAARGFDEAFFVMADLEMWFHLLEQGWFSYIDEPLSAFRQHSRQQTEKDRTSLAPSVENRELLQRYLDRSYNRLRRWVREYLQYDAVRRIVRRSLKVGAENEIAAVALREFGGAAKFRAVALKNSYREVLLKIRRFYERHLRRAVTREVGPLPVGINMAGFVQSVYGIGESSRAMWKAVRATGLPCALINIRSTVHSNADLSLSSFTKGNSYRVNLMTFSFDYARRFHRDMGARFFAGRYNIGLWYWEQERFPLRWHSAFDYYDEIWVPTEFTRRSLAAVSPIPVRKITYPFSLNEAEAIPRRQAFGLGEDACVFLFTFDFHSTIERKNPGAVIEAFRHAFRAGDNATLVVKSINSEHNRAAHQALVQQANGADVLFFDTHISRAEVNSLFASADCYVSLHRSEGLGLGMAQAMYLGKPVIATGYSGNLDFMNADNSLLVGYGMIELEVDSGAYEKGMAWADPDTAHAATLMRWVCEHRAESQALGARAAASIRATLNPATTAQEIVTRIGELPVDV